MRVGAVLELGTLEEALRRFAASVEGAAAEALRAAAPEIREDVRQQFAAGGVPTWRPLARSTVAEKRRAGYPRPNRAGQAPKLLVQNGRFGPANVLLRTGALVSSWVREDDPEHVERIEDGVLEIGSAVPYAATHQYGRPGGGWRGSDIPARPVTITDAGAARAARAVAEAGAGAWTPAT